MKNKIAYLFVIFFCSFSFFSDAQQSVEVPKEFAKEKAIYIKKKETYSIFWEKESIKAKSLNEEQTFVISEDGFFQRSRSIGSSTFAQVKDIKASTLVLGTNNKYKKIAVDDISYKDDIGSSNFYDDQKSYTFTFPSVQKASILDLSYEQDYKDAHFIGSFFFSDYIPVLNSELVLIVPNDIEINYKLFNTDSIDIIFTKQPDGNKTKWTWLVKKVNKIKIEDNHPNVRYYEPHIIFYISSFEKNKKEEKFLGTPILLNKWYRELTKNVNQTSSKEIKTLVDSLIKGSSSELESVKKIYYWVQEKISYTAFEDGLGGFVPRDASLICHRKFGDCKDMASLLHAMLTEAGIKSYLTWIGTRSIPYSYQEVPTLYADNHMITTYLSSEGKWYFLDGTNKGALLEQHSSMIQGKEALISINKDSAIIVKVPIIEAALNHTKDSIYISLPDPNTNVLLGTEHISLTGYPMVDFRYIYQRNKTKPENEKMLELFPRGNNKLTIEGISMIDSENKSNILLNYSIKIPDYSKKINEDVYINLNLNQTEEIVKIKEDRKKVPIEFENKIQNTTIVVFEIPKGYKLNFLPKNRMQKNKYGSFKSTYEQKGNKIVHTNEIVVESLLLFPIDFADWTTLSEEYSKSINETISITKIK